MSKEPAEGNINMLLSDPLNILRQSGFQGLHLFADR